MTDNVVHLSDIKNDARLVSKRDLLEKALAVSDNQDTPLGRANKVIIVSINDANGEFDVDFMNSKATCQDMIAAASILETICKNCLGYSLSPAQLFTVEDD